MTYSDPTGHWEVGDEYYSDPVQKLLIQYTDEYYAAKTDAQRQAASDKASKLRTSSTMYATPQGYGAAYSSAIGTTSYFTADTWKATEKQVADSISKAAATPPATPSGGSNTGSSTANNTTPTPQPTIGDSTNNSSTTGNKATNQVNTTPTQPTIGNSANDPTPTNTPTQQVSNTNTQPTIGSIANQYGGYNIPDAVWSFFTTKLEGIPLTNYLQAFIGIDLNGNKLSSDQRWQKFELAVSQGLDAVISAYMMGGIEEVGGGSFGSEGVWYPAVGSGDVKIILKNNYKSETVDLYRAIGIREYQSIIENKAFVSGANSLEGRQFAFSESEALKYADTDFSKVVIVKATIPKDILNSFDFSKNIDPNIFKNGVITVQPESNTLFNQSLISIEFLP